MDLQPQRCRRQTSWEHVAPCHLPKTEGSERDPRARMDGISTGYGEPLEQDTHQASSHGSDGGSLAEPKDTIEWHGLLRQEVSDVPERRLQSVEASVLLVSWESPGTELFRGSVVGDVGGVFIAGSAISGTRSVEDVERVD